jgi:hypothetical protein
LIRAWPCTCAPSALLALHQATGPREPSARLCHVADDRQVDPEEDRRPRGPQRLLCLRVRAVGPLEHRQKLVDPAEHVRRDGETLEVRGGEWLGLVGACERVARGDPRSEGEVASGAIELGGRLHRPAPRTRSRGVGVSTFRPA